MTHVARRSSLLRALILFVALSAWAAPCSAEGDADSIELGHRIYTDGILPSGEPMTGLVNGDVEIAGDFVVCGRCHRRSGLGSIEGTSIVPVVVGSMLYEDLALPTSRPPLPPVQRPAYTRETLARSIRDGISPTGEEFSVLMPRYELSDDAMDDLLDYLESLSMEPDPGVTETDIHFATILDDSVSKSQRKALLDVLTVFIEQKNTETRYETKRKESGPWHKDWNFKPYRKWVLHVWDLSGPQSGWAEQLQAHYDEQPVFAVLNGMVAGDWQPIHDYCEQQSLPCLFPTTVLPVIDESDFYSVYFSKGISLEANVLVEHLREQDVEEPQVLQVYRSGDPLGETAATELVERFGDSVTSFVLPEQASDFQGALEAADGDKATSIVAWLGEQDLEDVLSVDSSSVPVYLSSSFIDTPQQVPDALDRTNTFVIFTSALPSERRRLLMRSTGWLRAKRIYSQEEQLIQANAYFALKIAGGSLTFIHTFFSREYFLESIEHMIDNAIYTANYSHMSLAPEQRFVSKGGLIAGFDSVAPDRFVAVSDWLIPDVSD